MSRKICVEGRFEKIGASGPEKSGMRDARTAWAHPYIGMAIALILL